MKICSQCKLSKKANDFYNNSSKPDKLQNMCKRCTKINDKKRVITGSRKKYNALYFQTITAEKMKDPDYRKDHNAYKSLQKRTNVARARLRQKYATNLQKRLSQIIRTRIRAALLTGALKSADTLKLLGCNIKQLKTWISKRFLENMSWDNYGQWHIDHIKPCALFNLDDPEEQKRCFHFSNLQPLWAKDNLKKGCKSSN